MSRDESLRDRFARLKQLHGRPGHLRRDQAERDRDLEEAARAAEEARRLREELRGRAAQRAGRRGRQALDANAIAKAGVAIADAQGLEEVSMRKIAALLGSGTMSLYHYVRTKEDLLAAMEDIIMGEVLVPERVLRNGWRKAMTSIADATRAVYRRHPWALGIQSRGGEPGLNGLRHVEQSLTALAPTGLSFDDQLAIIVIVDDFVFGHALRVIENSAVNEHSDEALDVIARYMHEHVNAAEFPTLTASIGDQDIGQFVRRMAKVFQPEEWFEVGLEALLDGLARRFKLDI